MIQWRDILTFYIIFILACKEAVTPDYFAYMAISIPPTPLLRLPGVGRWRMEFCVWEVRRHSYLCPARRSPSPGEETLTRSKDGVLEIRGSFFFKLGRTLTLSRPRRLGIGTRLGRGLGISGIRPDIGRAARGRTIYDMTSWRIYMELKFKLDLNLEHRVGQKAWCI